MIKCKKCIHYDICKQHFKVQGYEIESIEKLFPCFNCEYYDNKFNYIRLIEKESENE